MSNPILNDLEVSDALRALESLKTQISGTIRSGTARGVSAELYKAKTNLQLSIWNLEKAVKRVNSRRVKRIRG